MNITAILELAALGIVFGAVGQIIRAILGIKKDQAESNKTWDDWVKDHFSGKTLILSILIGAIAGVLAVVASYQSIDPANISSKFLMGLMAAGYAGTDFIEGVMQKAKVP